MKISVLAFRFLSYSLVFSILMSCASWSNTEKGVAIGAGSGAALGGILGNKSGNTARGAAIGAAAGAAVGAAIGIYMDKQAKKMEEEIKNAEVERVGDAIKVTFESGILFGFDSFALTAEARENITKFAGILQEYPDTNISIEGHTDSKGSRSYNQRLSENRAKAVRDFLAGQGVVSTRMNTVGYAFDRPVASNETEEGRAKNRRVEILITANEDLVQKAEKGEIKN